MLFIEKWAIMKLSIFENAIKKSHNQKKSNPDKSQLRLLRLILNAKIKAHKIESLPKIDERLPHVQFKHKSQIINAFECLDQYDLQLKEKAVKALANELNGIVIRPNEVFSFWKNIKDPRPYNQKSMNFASVQIKGTSPAVSQVTNLLYWLILHSPLEITERHRHEFDLFKDYSRQRPFGTGATCIYRYYDLKFQNKTDSIYQIGLTYCDGVLSGELRSLTLPYLVYDVYEERQVIKKNVFGDYLRHNTIYRRIINTKTNKEKVEYVTENHALMFYKPTISEGVDFMDVKMGDVPLWE